MAAKLGIEAASAITTQANLSIQNSAHANPNIDRVPSPDQNFDVSIC